MKLLSVVFFAIFSLASAQEVLECDYQVEDSVYTCVLSIANPEGRDNWTAIGGSHLDGFSDGDVGSVRAFYQQTMNVPRILCSTFGNLSEISITRSQVRSLSPQALENCANLHTLTLSDNLIGALPDSAFINNGNLRFLNLGDNFIAQLSVDTFAGSRLEAITLDYNDITTLVPGLFDAVRGSLRSLSLHSNLLKEIPSGVFGGLESLETLHLSVNYISVIASDAFAGLNRLNTLSLDGNALTSLQHEWFAPLTAVENLRLEFNSIAELPIGIFENNNHLTDLGLTFNKLTEVSSSAFGNLSNLRTFYGEFNNINAIDSEFFDRAKNLNGLYLIYNVCAQSNFYDVLTTRTSVRQALQTCFDNYNVESTLECFYLAAEFFPYTCELTVVNPQGRDDFESIAGEHVAGNGDSDVLRVEGEHQNTLNIPSIICDRFTNLQELTLTVSLVEVLTARTFASCKALTALNLEHNNITALTDDVFAATVNLEILILNDNHIASIGTLPFTATRLWYIDLQHNELVAFNSAWFTAINETLRSLNLNGNFISSLPAFTFGELRNLEELEIAANPLQSIPADAFSGLTRLGYLALYRTNIAELLPAWFADLTSLHSLHIENNAIRELPAGIFSALNHLNDINLSQNQLTSVDLSAFGNASAMETFNAQFNQIDAIDPEFFDAAERLYILFLYGNACLSMNLINVIGSRELVRNTLTTCFENFIASERGTIACQYVDGGEFGYQCEMSVQNPRGTDDFEQVEGNHLDGFTDADVWRVEAYRQLSPLVPRIICSQFTNLHELYFGASDVIDLQPSSFESCTSLVYLNLELNTILQIPPNLFINTPNLASLSFSLNQLNAINENALASTALTSLWLDGNNFVSLDQIWLGDISTSLEFLSLANNSITELMPNTFASLTRLRDLDLSLNNLANIADSAFAGLAALEFIWLYRTAITAVHPDWFADMPALLGVHINYNQLTSLPSGLFRNNPHLFELNVAGNQLRIIDNDVFADPGALFFITATNNRLRALDPRVFDAASDLYGLFLAGNLCVDENFLSVTENRSAVRDSLTDCFQAFEREGELACLFLADDFLPYRCELSVRNIAGRDDFEAVEGEHVNDFADGDVVRLESFGQLTFNFPRVICAQFGNLAEIYFAFGGIEVLTPEAFGECSALTYLNLEFNAITTLNGGVLNNLANLASLSFHGNELTVIEGDAFDGLALTYLNLDVNRLSYVNPAWFEASPLLEYLTLASNSLVSLPSAPFRALERLETLILSNNGFAIIPDDAFEGLASLSYINLNNCSLTGVNPAWLAGLDNLQQLYLQANAISSLPPGIFVNLTRINVANNALVAITRDAFVNVDSLVQLNAQNNHINGVEEAFFNEASSLFTFQLLNNLCTSTNFINVPANREFVREELSTCFGNFEATEIACEYMYDFPYTCYLTLFNPLARDDFEVIGGSHLSGRGDDDVVSVDAIDQTSNVFPEVICRQFTNLNYVYVINSGISVLTADTFAQCTHLMSLTLDDNRITELGDGFFTNSPTLALISLANNRITRVSENALSGTNLMLFDIERNEIAEISANFFSNSRDMIYLFASGNRFTSLPAGLFSGMSFLSLLDISRNAELSELPEDTFAGLSFVFTLRMDNCNISSLSPNLFNDLGSLADLNLSGNSIGELPIGVFDRLQSLGYLAIDNMELETLDARSFAGSLSSLSVIRARGNRINAVDPLILEKSLGRLEDFYLLNNVCVDNNFSDVQANIEEVRGDLYRCFANFG